MKYWKIHYLIGFAFFDIVEPRNLPEIFSTDLWKKTCWFLISEKKLIGSMYDTSSYQFQFLCSIVGWTWFFSTIGVSVELDDALLKFQLQGMPLKDTQTTVKGNEKSLKKMDSWSPKWVLIQLPWMPNQKKLKGFMAIHPIDLYSFFVTQSQPIFARCSCRSCVCPDCSLKYYAGEFSSICASIHPSQWFYLAVVVALRPRERVLRVLPGAKKRVFFSRGGSNGLQMQNKPQER